MDKRVAIFTISLALFAGSGTAIAQDASRFTPDNSATNIRDRSSNAVTADSQSNSKNDVELTAGVRRAIENDKSLSTMAHNVKVISSNGQVTLRGPVPSDREKSAVESDAQAAGATNVDNRLEVVRQ